jgi:peptidyl-prolyl cis-trans isomerase C
VQNHPAPTPLEAWRAAARALVVRELLLQEARRTGIEAAPLSDDDGRRETADEARIRGVIEAGIHSPEASQAECRRYYDNNRARFRSDDLFEVRHILIAAAPGDTAARRRARDEARAIVAELDDDPAAFARLAAAHSACPSKLTGGNLGQIGKGQTVPEFERALVDAPLGAPLPEPVETRFGFHVVAVERRIAGADLPFEAVAPRIRAWLGEHARRTAIRQYIAILAGRADIRGVELEAAASPLVQ